MIPRTAVMGDLRFKIAFVVEQDESFYGPFDDERAALVFAVENLDYPFTLHELNCVDGKGGLEQ
jgi:hypothetical protein